MSEQPITASAIMSTVERLEDTSAAFYTALAAAYPAQAKLFQGYAEDCEKHKTQILRTYQETVTDALETNFSFEGLSLAKYAFEATPSGKGLSEDLKAALNLEETAIAFYTQVAKACESLLATIPRTLARVAKRRARRRDELRELQP